jgi:hypothetical protein
MCVIGHAASHGLLQPPSNWYERNAVAKEVATAVTGGRHHEEQIWMGNADRIVHVGTGISRR